MIDHKLTPRATVAWFFGIFLFALAFRVTGHRFGLPYLWHPDEPEQINRALQMLKEGSFNPERFNYPTLNIYLQMVAGALGYIKLVGAGPYVPLSSLDTGMEAGYVHTIGSPEMWADGRMVTVLMGSLACALTFLAGRRLFDDATGLVAGLVLAAAPHHVENSRYITVDVPTSTALAALLLASGYILYQGERRHYVFAALSLGAVLGFKYNAAVAAAVPLAAWLLSGKAEERLWWGLALVPLGGVFFVMSSPYVVLDLSKAVGDIAAEVNHYQWKGNPGADVQKGLPHLWVMLKYLFVDAFPGWAVLALVGAGVGLKRARAPTILVLAFPVLFILYMSRTTVWFARNLIHAEPPIAILVGVGAVAVWRLAATRWPRAQPALLVAGALVLSLPAAFTAKAAVDLGNQEDSRVTLADWIRTAGPANAVVAVPYELRLDERTLDGIKTVPVSLVSETPEDWALKGATLVIGGPRMRLDHQDKIELTDSGLVAARAWFGGHTPLHAEGWAEWAIDTVTVNPYVGVYALEKAVAPISQPGTVVGAGVAAATEIDVPGGWEVTPPQLFGRYVRFGNGLLVVRHRRGDPTAVVCGPRVPATHQARVFGYWRREVMETLSGVGARVTLRCFDGTDKLVAGQSAATGGIQAIAASKAEGGPWEEIDSVQVLPPGTAKARVCLEVDADRAEVWSDDLRVMDAF